MLKDRSDQKAKQVSRIEGGEGAEDETGFWDLGHEDTCKKFGGLLYWKWQAELKYFEWKEDRVVCELLQEYSMCNEAVGENEAKIGCGDKKKRGFWNQIRRLTDWLNVVWERIDR